LNSLGATGFCNELSISLNEFDKSGVEEFSSYTATKTPTTIPAVNILVTREVIKIMQNSVVFEIGAEEAEDPFG
jgi:hypothetical protein